MTYRNIGILAAILLAFVLGYYLKSPETVKIAIPGPVRFEPKIEYIDTGSTKVIQLPAGPIDSAAVVEAYYTKRPFFFEDTAQDVAIRFDGILFENRLIAPNLTLHNFREPVINLPWQVWGDFEAGRNSLRLGASIEKGPNRFGLGYDLIQGTATVKYSRLIFTF